MADRIQLRRDTAANWTSINPVLAQGELGIETDTRKLKVGDGSTAWSGLGYLIDTGDYLVHDDVDDVPVNGAADVPVSSNWAYDHSVLLATETDNRVLYDEELTRAVTYATDLAGQAARTLSGSLPSNVPASASAPGVAGQMRYASGYLYVCVASNTWQRVAIATW